MFSLSTDRREGDKVRVKSKRLVSRRGCPRHATPLSLRFIPRPSMPPRRAKRGVRLNPHIILRQAKASLRMISHNPHYHGDIFLSMIAGRRLKTPSRL